MKNFILLFILTLTGCAITDGSTAYQPQGLTGGFSSVQLDTNVFTVSFKGNGFTDMEKATDYALLRSAEVALENDFEYFTIIDSDEYVKTNTYTTPVQSTTTVKANTSGNAYNVGNNTYLNSNTTGKATTTYSGGEVKTFTKPRSTNTIFCFKDKPEGFSYDAQMIINSLKASYNIE